jgi:hypothetical protein
MESLVFAVLFHQLSICEKDRLSALATAGWHPLSKYGRAASQLGESIVRSDWTPLGSVGISLFSSDFDSVTAN